MDKYLKLFLVVIFIILFGWLYVNTMLVNNASITANEYNRKIDSLENRIEKLEYFIENIPNQIVVNVNTKNK